jgi:hypothetical protein
VDESWLVSEGEELCRSVEEGREKDGREEMRDYLVVIRVFASTAAHGECD